MKLADIFEDKNRKAVFSYGRMNPPTVGHEKLINAVKAIANNKNADVYIFPTKTQDKKRNPLDFDTKVFFLKAFFPDVTIVDDITVRTIIDAVYWLIDRGYNDITLVVGSDRVQEFRKMIQNYVPSLNPDVDPKKAISIDNFSIISAGHRDPDSEGIIGISGSKARKMVANKHKLDFVNLAAPKSGTKRQKVALYNAVREALGEK